MTSISGTQNQYSNWNSAVEPATAPYQPVLTEEISWTLLPPLDLDHWDLEFWKDFAKFIKVFNHDRYGHKDFEKAERELKEKYKENYDLVCHGFEHAVRAALYENEDARYAALQKKTIPVLSLPPFDWNDWDHTHWDLYKRHLKKDNSNPLSAIFNPFFDRIKFHNYFSASIQIPKSVEELDKFLHSIKEGNQKKASDHHFVAVIKGSGTAASSAAVAKKVSANETRSNPPATYSYDPKNWNMNDWRTMRDWHSAIEQLQRESNLKEESSDSESDDDWTKSHPITIKFQSKHEFFHTIGACTSDSFTALIDIKHDPDITPEEKETLSEPIHRRATLQRNNERYMMHHLFRAFFSGNYDKIPQVQIKDYSERDLKINPITVQEVPFGLCRTGRIGREALLFKMNNRVDLLFERTSPEKNYYKEGSFTVILLDHLSRPDFITDIEAHYSYVLRWNARCLEIINASLKDQTLLRDLKRIVAEYSWPEVLYEEASLTNVVAVPSS